MKKVYITRRLPQIAQDLLSKHFLVKINPHNKPIHPRELHAVVRHFDAVLSTVCDTFTKEILDIAGTTGTLKVISNYAVGLDNIDTQTAKKHHIAVYNTPDAVTQSTADFTFAILLALIRRIPEAYEFVRNNKWQAWDPELLLGMQLSGKKIGIVGFGRIGQAVAKRAEGFGLKILYANRSNRPVVSDIKSADNVSFDVLLAESDIISLHVPLTDSTRNLINKESIKKMKKKPYIINMSRGPVVNTADLTTALKRGLLRAAALDVTDPEPLRSDHPLCTIENCLITPHIGTATSQCRKEMAKIAAENIINHFSVHYR